MTRSIRDMIRLKYVCRSCCGMGILAATLLLAPTPQADAQGAPVIYPSGGQSMQQQALDETECRTWAQGQTGFNPSQGPSYEPNQSTGGEVVGGAARGALLGVVGGAIAGDVGKGAAVGAGVGATSGLMRKGRKNRENDQAQQQAVADYNARLGDYNRAFSACMQGRGYVVN